MARGIMECPHCGATFRAGRAACPECGSDARTGWQDQEEIDYQSLDLDPTGYEGSGRPHANAKRNRIIALVVVIAMVLMLIVALRR